MKIETQKLRDMAEGIIQKVDNLIVPQNSVYLAVNLLFHKNLGRATVRSGTTQLGSQLVNNKTILGLYQFNKSGVKIPLAVINDSGDANSDIFEYSGSPASWTIATGGTNLTKDIKSHFVTFLDTVAILNGSDACKSSANGTTFVTTGGNLDVGNMPQGKYGMEWKDKMYVAGVTGNLNRLYFSSTPIAGAISWTSGNGYIDINEGEGDMTGLSKVPGYLLIFKDRSMKRWDGTSTYPESMIDIGAPSQEAIVQTKQSVFYFNKRGIYETIGGYPRKISRRIQDVIEAIPSTYYSSVSGWGDGENVYFSIGDIEIDGLTLNNCVVQYHLDNQVWTVLAYPNEFKAWGMYVDSNEDEILMAGDDDGNVWKVMNGTGDAGSDVIWTLQYHSQEIGSRGRIKDLSKFVVYSKKIRNGEMYCRVNEEGDFDSIGNIKEDEQEIIKDIKGRQFEFRLRGQGTEGDLIGIDFPETNVNLNYKE